MSRSPSHGIQLRKIFEACIRQGKAVSDKDIGHMAKARLTQQLANTDCEGKLLPQYIRLGLEVSGTIGAGRDSTHQHLHVEIPAGAQEMIAQRMMELYAEKEKKKALVEA